VNVEGSWTEYTAIHLWFSWIADGCPDRTGPEPRSVFGSWNQTLHRTTKDRHGH
jgi:hypothetical protein